jgi:acetyl-CoA carboxylase biotin carboxyl carrier protein
MTIEEIKQLVEIVQESGIAELEVTMGDGSVKIRNASATANKEIVLPTVLPVSMAASPTPALNVNPVAHHAQQATEAPAPPASEETPEEENGVLVKSPIVGTYYDAPSPGAPPFVKIGDRVEPKQVLCIIESMKLMNEIEAEIAGTILAKYLENGRPVEYGESLFTIRPL